jgi:hypothetical protein
MAVRYAFDDEESGTVQYEGSMAHRRSHSQWANVGSIGASRL